MLGKILGGIAGAKAAKHSNKVGGATGALLGAAAGSIIRRASIPGLIAMTVGGYALKKWKDRRDAETAKRKSFETPPAGAAA
jgi:surface antigen